MHYENIDLSEAQSLQMRPFKEIISDYSDIHTCITRVLQSMI